MPSDPKRVQAIFLTAVEQPDPAARAAVLARECGGDADLRGRVEALLKANDDPASFLDRPAVDAVPDGTGAFAPGPDDSAPPGLAAEAPGQWVGPYRLLQEIGEGGMGTVWMAEQEHPVRRRVALKVIKPGMDSAQVVARFEAERQALALMDHQNIAKVLDAGTAPLGRPYFVMELIKGVPITKFCDEHHLTPRERLELFVPVCQAVQHAHQKGVIHRDLKPSNVLVTLYDGRPVPKVIDFGVAKALHQRLTDRTLFTGFGAVVGTLEYMAPEQAALSHLDVDTRSDVYSLGVLLYELLTGTTPFERKRLRQAALDEMLRIIREEEPPRPSTRLSESGDSLPSIAAARKTEPAKLSRLMKGELDWIVMKALDKDRGRRYETANGFARDVQRYLADEPVEACPPSAGYRLRKFARKHRRLLITAAAFVILLALAAAVSTGLAVWALRSQRTAITAQRDAEEQRDRASAARRRTREALDAMVSEVTGEALAVQKALSDEQRAFLNSVLSYYQEFAAEPDEDREGRERMAKAHDRLGSIRFRLGQTEESARLFQRSGDLYAKLAADYPDSLDYRLALAGSHSNLGFVLSDLGRWPEAEAEYRASLGFFAKLVVDFPDSPEYRQRLARSQTNLGRLLRNAGRLAEAETEFRTALAAQEKLATDFPAVPDYRQEMAISHNGLGLLLDHLVRRAEAEAEFRASQAIKEKLVVDYPAVPAYRNELAASRGNLGNLFMGQGRSAEAEAEFRAALALQEKLAADFPAVPEYRRFVALTHNNLGPLLAGQEKRVEAEVEFRAALALLERLAADFPALPAHRSELANSYRNLGRLQRAMGQRSEAAATYQMAVTVWAKLAAEFPDVSEHRSNLADSHNERGLLLHSLRRPSEAEAEYRAALALHSRLAADFPAVPRYRRNMASHHNNLGNVLSDLGRPAEADPEFRAAISIQEKLAAEYPAVGDYAVQLGGNYCNFGNLIRDRGEPAALDWYAKAIAALEPVHRADPRLAAARQFLRNSHWGRAQALGTLGRPAPALADWERALELDDGAQATALRLGRADALARVGEAGKALAAADEVAATPNLSAARVYELACVYARAGSQLPPPDAGPPAARAVGLLRQAVLKGYRNFAHLLQDSDLDSLRRRNDYADLLWDLADLPPDRQPRS
jgi:serine/threonine protein kinase/tetratricopeptide (TPR) repeat protein